MEPVVFFSPEDVRFIDQCFANRERLEAVLSAKSTLLWINKDAEGRIRGYGKLEKKGYNVID